MTEKPIVKIGVDTSAIPQELQELPRWVVWKYHFHKKTKKWIKLPFAPSGANVASSTNPETWGAFDTACSTYLTDDFDGIGFMFNGDGIVGVDLDDAVTDSGMSDAARDALLDVAGYAELSPSGEGLHIITRSDYVKGVKKGVEVYSSERYFTFTGAQINGHTTIPALKQDISPFMLKHFGESNSATPKIKDEVGIHKTALGRDIEHMRSVLRFVKPKDTEPECTPYIWAIHHEADGSDEALALAHEWLAGALHNDPQPKYDPAYVDERWGRADDSKEGAKTWRSVEAEARKNGWSGNAPVSKKPVMSAAEFAGTGNIEWHIKHVIPKRGLIVVYGAPGSSKSFFVLDLVAHIVRGEPWRGHRTKKSNVFYAVAEGAEGFKTRVKAYHEYNNTVLDGLYIRPGGLHLTDQALDLCEQINEVGNVGVVVIDTLAAVTPGANENVSEDMGRAIAEANRITEATGASVILIHHANRQGELRGWSGLLAAADNTIRVEHDKMRDVRTAHIEKQKEAKSDGEYGYKLRVVDLGVDEDGDAITSCVVEECEETAPNTSGKAKTDRKPRSGDFETSANYDKARKHLEIIQELVGLSGANIDEADVIAAIQADKTLNPMGYEDTPAARNIKRTLHTLGTIGKIRVEGRWIRLC